MNHAKLPVAHTAEKSLLGAVMLKPSILGWLEVTERAFHEAPNLAIWRAMQAIHASGEAIDEVTLEVELERSGKLGAIGGLAYLSRVAMTVPTSANAESYAKTLERYRITREVLQAVADVPTVSDGIMGEELLDSVLSRLSAITRIQANEKTAVSSTLPDLVRRMIDDVDAIAKGDLGSSLCPTGIPSLDARITGIPLGTVTAIGGRPGGGKSSSLLNFAENAARLGKVAVIFTTEDPRDRWGERLLAKHGNLRVDRLYARHLGAIDLNKAAQASDDLKALSNLHVVHAHGMTALEITRIATGMGAGFVGVDYIQKVAAPEPRMKLHEAIEANSKIFGDYAGKSGAGVVILSQMSKDIEKEDRRPRKSDLRYGEGLVQEAKLIILLHDPKNRERPMLREMLVAKRNQGESEMIAEVLFDGAHCRFLEVTAIKSQMEF